MNAKKAKALRKQVGFVPSAERLFTKISHGTRVELRGNKLVEVEKFQFVVTGLRHLYQQVKRGRVTL